MSDLTKPIPADLALTAGLEDGSEDDLPPLGATEVVAYIEDMCGELAEMAARFDCRFLSYLLRVAQEEAAAAIGTPH